jgi:hypothetical protein
MFAIVVDVTNNPQQAVEVFVDLQAVDDDGFELADVTLRGSLGPKETKHLSEQNYLLKRDLARDREVAGRRRRDRLTAYRRLYLRPRSVPAAGSPGLSAR